MNKKANANANANANAAAAPGSDKPKGKLVGAVVNASKIMRFLRAAQSPVTVTHITRAVNINPSTCFNILRTLIQEDFVQFDATAKTYQLSLGLVALARGALENSPELHLLKPKIEELARNHRMMVAVWRRISDARMMLVAVAESDAPVRIHARAGSRSPLLLGASGRVFAAYSHMSRSALKERFQELRLARPLDFESYLEQLEEVRRTGWALDDGFATPGTITLAAPVPEPNGALNFTVAAILFNGQYDLQRVSAIAQEMKRVGQTLIDAAPTTMAYLVGPALAAKRAAAKSRAVKAPAVKALKALATRPAETPRPLRQRAAA